MRKIKISIILIGLAMDSILLTEPSNAQYAVKQSVLGSGGTAVSNGSHHLVSTLGQPGIGVVSGPSHINEAGFWYQASNIITSVELKSKFLPKEFRLEQNYPNPFNPSTTIRYTLPERDEVTLKIFDVHGREVRELVRATQEAGYYEVNFEAGNLASGVYFFRLDARGRTSWSQTRKLAFIK